MLRIIDANLNRLGEGLRVLEDVARFVLNDTASSRQLKQIRHRLLSGHGSLEKQLLGERDAAGDVGAFAEAEGEGERKDFAAVVTANARRVQESLRVIEELGKLPGSPVDWQKFKQARFEIYELEPKLLSQLLRLEMRRRISGLYVIVDTQFLKGDGEVEAARLAISGGARIIQLRDKQRPKGKSLAVARELKKLCQEAGVLFIINDHLDLAILSDADGLHVGQQDLPLTEVRPRIGVGKIVGCSSHNVAEAQWAEAHGADYIAVGSIFPTQTKDDITLAGLETLRQVKQAVSLPVVAIGGISQDNVSQVVQAGADSAAVISAVLGADDIERAARQFARVFEEEK